MCKNRNFLAILWVSVANLIAFKTTYFLFLPSKTIGALNALEAQSSRKRQYGWILVHRLTSTDITAAQYKVV